MEHLLNKRVKAVRASAIRSYSEKVKCYPDGIDLTIGQPDFQTPEHIKHAGIRAIERNKTGYTPSAGIRDLRMAACQFAKEMYGLDYDWRTEISVMNGATQALDVTFRTILEEGSEVILAGPSYPGYLPLIEMCGATPVLIDTREHGFKISAELIEEKITDKTRCVLLSYPSNPLGTILSREELKEIASLLRNYEIFIVSDEIYSELIFDHAHHSIAEFPEVKKQTIVINGVSKAYSMTGWRIGFIYAEDYLIREMLKVHMFNTSCANSISQYAAEVALKSGNRDSIMMKKVYKERRNYIYQRLIDIGFTVNKPEASFYIFPSIKNIASDSLTFANCILEQKRVAVVPGSAFSYLGEGYIRISFAVSMEILEEALLRIEQYVQSTY